MGRTIVEMKESHLFTYVERVTIVIAIQSLTMYHFAIIRRYKLWNWSSVALAAIIRKYQRLQFGNVATERTQTGMQFSTIPLTCSLAQVRGNPRSAAVFCNFSVLARQCREERRSCATLIQHERIVIHIWARIRLILPASTVYGPYLDRNGSIICPRSRFIHLAHLAHPCFSVFPTR